MISINNIIDGDINFAKLKSLKINFTLSFITTVLMILPDYFLAKHIVTEPLFILYLFGFNFLLSMTPLWFIYFFYILFFIMESIQFNFLVFFGHPITPSDIINIVKEKTDVFDVYYLNKTYFVMPTLIFVYGTIAFLYKKYQKQYFKCALMMIVVLFIAGHKPYRAYTASKNIWYFQPGPTRSSLKNSINTFSYFFFQYLWKNGEITNIVYHPYKILPTETTAQNILLIWGESLYSKHLPMYAYERNTFPKTTQLLNNKIPYVQTQVLSSGIATATSTTLFFNTIREPGNLNEIKNKTANLFRNAKNNGFATYYFSNQESRLLMDLDAESIDNIINNDSDPFVFSKMHDEGLTHFLKKINLKDGKNFIVLHIRAPHSPYEKHYKNRPEFNIYPADKFSDNRLTYDTNTYDNALNYVDSVIYGMLSYFIQQNNELGTNYKIFLTADHGQLFNHNGLWGHNNLDIEQSMVPGIIIGNNLPTVKKLTPAYEFGKIILNSLGSTLKNENEQNNIFYLHGNNVEFSYDYLEYEIDQENNINVRAKKNTSELSNRR